ncbi:PREDICTED: vesicle-associated membrane protein 7-like [Amphimedon queenslandica]|uniref:Longin domain-containing protein n=1 Tax=Amphimedon queenslandica TaxID=400682 RepID=A0A1X7VMU6_AMPQE|nr:PREDICTED: vesicle-associated membrane protein 7-like [Amphimedon queenslandica]|eukprot:XP_011409701.1 PREDICTED: vesicle-associated membrane protein 7-like [Amphimedon queenslandica]
MASYGTLGSIQSPGIIYSSISRGSTILALHASCDGNFAEVVPQILSVISRGDLTSRLTYTSGDYMFHYVSEEGIIFLCITGDDFERSRAFMFLEHVKSDFFDTYGDNFSQLTPYSLNASLKGELSRKMQQYSEDSYFIPNGDQTMIRLDTIRVKAFESISESGIELERLELLESSDNYSLRSFEQQIVEGRNFCKECCRKYYRNWLVICIFVFVLVIILTAIIVIIVVTDEDIDHPTSSTALRNSLP